MNYITIKVLEMGKPAGLESDWAFLLIMFVCFCVYVIIHLRGCNEIPQTRGEGVTYKQQEFISHVSGVWKS